MLIVGLMSGTSLDGIDAALVEVDGETPDELRWEVVRFCCVPFTERQRSTIHGAILAGTADALCTLHADLGEWLADAVVRLCEAADVPLEQLDAIGSHGQTVWHRLPGCLGFPGAGHGRGRPGRAPRSVGGPRAVPARTGRPSGTGRRPTAPAAPLCS